MARKRSGGAIDPIATYRASGYRNRKAEERPSTVARARHRLMATPNEAMGSVNANTGTFCAIDLAQAAVRFWWRCSPTVGWLRRKSPGFDIHSPPNSPTRPRDFVGTLSTS